MSMEPPVFNIQFSCIFLVLILLLNPPSLSSKTNSSPSKNNVSNKNMLPPSSPLSFLRNLVGSKNGDKAEDLGKLKKHLSTLGYINIINRPNDLFDDELEQALKKYQAFFGLCVTGVLNLETIESLSLPRCGVADHFHFTDASQFKNQTPYSESHYSIPSARNKWPVGRLTYAISNKSKPDNIDPRVGIDRALLQWAVATKYYFSFIYTDDFDNAAIMISFERGDHGDGDPFDGPGGIVGHADLPTAGALHFDLDERWTNGAKNDMMDMRSAALHELGHILGLGHSSNKKAIMYPTMKYGERKYLDQDDIDGISDLYNLHI